MLGGIFTYFILSSLGVLPHNSSLLLFAVLGSITPDLDHPKSFISHLTLITRVLSYGFSEFGHRTLLHSVLGIALWYVILKYLLPFVGIILGYYQILAFLLGYTSHLVLDSLTVRGIDWTWPFGFIRTRFIIKTGSIGELIFALLLLVGIFIYH